MDFTEHYLLNDIADALRLHSATVCNMAKAGKLPALKIGKIWVFSKETFENIETIYLKSKGVNVEKINIYGDYILAVDVMIIFNISKNYPSILYKNGLVTRKKINNKWHYNKQDIINVLLNKHK